MEWISINDKLPEDGDYILISDGILPNSFFGRYYSGQHVPFMPWWFLWENVKFWMKIPELPE